MRIFKIFDHYHSTKAWSNIVVRSDLDDADFTIWLISKVDLKDNVIEIFDWLRANAKDNWRWHWYQDRLVVEIKDTSIAVLFKLIYG